MNFSKIILPHKQYYDKKSAFKNMKRTENLIQQDLFQIKKSKYSFGGALGEGKRKEKRPILPNKWMHLCLKSKRAFGSLSLWHKQKRPLIEKLIKRKAKEHNVVLKDAINMGNHIHMKIKVKHHEDFKKFLRSIAGQIARIMTGAKKGKSFGKYWDALAFTRIIISRFEELQLKGYFSANRVERQRGYQARVATLKKFNDWLRGLKAQTSTA